MHIFVLKTIKCIGIRPSDSFFSYHRLINEIIMASLMKIKRNLKLIHLPFIDTSGGDTLGSIVLFAGLSIVFFFLSLNIWKSIFSFGLFFQHWSQSFFFLNFIFCLSKRQLTLSQGIFCSSIEFWNHDKKCYIMI